MKFFAPIFFAQPVFFWAALCSIPIVAALFYWAWRVKQKLVEQFISARLLPALTVGISPARQTLRLGLLTAAVAATLLAVARPQWGFTWEESHQKGLDIIVAIDTSKSMLAQDVAPNRLERAKLAAYDLMRQARSDRLGLVAFAGTAFLQSPLTLDDVAFRQGVDALNVGIIPQGGTALSAAIHTAMEAFEKNNDNHKVLVLFTDGEDHDTADETIAAAKEAAEAGVHIFTIGVGTPEGELLRVRDNDGNFSYVKDENGDVVKSRLNTKLLQEIATDANGFYLPLQGPDPMASLYARGLAPLPKSEGATRRSRVPLERYHWPLAFAVLCLLVECLLPESPRSRRSPGSASRRAAQMAGTTVCFLLVALSTHASPSGAFHDYQSGDYKGAFDEYNRLSEINSNDYRLHYDAGAAAYRAKQLDKAEKQFNATLASPSVAPDVTAQERTYYDLGNTEYHLGEPLSEPEKKQERWQQAIDNYTQALRLNTNDVDARNNLQYVQQKLEQLKQQQQQQNQQNKDQKNQKNDKNQQNQQNQKNQQNQDKNQQDQQQQSGKNDQQKNQGQKSAQEKKKEEEQKRQQEQAKKDKEKKEQQQQEQEAQNKPGEQKDQAQEQAVPGRMTPQEARQILASQKDDEKALIFAPSNAPVSTQTGKIKDW